MKIDFKFSRLLYLSNILSIYRAFLVIPLWLLIGNINNSLNLTLLILVVITGMLSDFLDGYYARKLNQVTEEGKIIDPLADKIVVAAVSIKLYTIGVLDPLLFWIVILRDLFIVIPAFFISSKFKSVPPSNMTGKIAVNVIAVFFISLMFGLNKDSLIYTVLYYAAIIMIIVSFSNYLLISVKRFKGTNETL
ncbi:MAG: CDP-alcohol phosphatidyltransferase family protein [Ignavibacteriaceae bacterium]|nr:CDP-alcohol phosphatidyltransferase family protein [Ignavibacteriaceae bacterium]